MKRFFTTILCLSMAVILALSASGCNKKSALVFNNAFFGSTNDPSPGYTETLKYSVSNVNNYNELIKKEVEIFTDSLATYEYKGTYESVFSVVGVLPEEIETNVSEEITGTVYHLKTTLKLNSTYKVNGEYAEGGTQNQDGSVTYEDVVENEVYFLKSGHSFAPVYSSGRQKSSTLALSNKANVIIYEYSYNTTYNTNKYTTVKGYVQEEPVTNKYEYTFKTVIDNAQLLFALRSVTLEEKDNLNIPVVSPVYGKAQTLTITNSSENTKSATINGETLQIPVKNLNFKLAQEYNTGTPQYALIQKSSPNEQVVPNKALLIEYAEPIISYGNFYSMGALVYTLTDVEING